MKISYSILTHNETESLSELIQFLVKHKDEEDEIVILDDYSDNEKTPAYLDVVCSIHEIKFEQRHLDKDYAGQKNHLTRMCSGEYIINIDADELPNKWLMKNIKSILEENPTIDLFWIPTHCSRVDSSARFVAMTASLICFCSESTRASEDLSCASRVFDSC